MMQQPDYHDSGAWNGFPFKANSNLQLPERRPAEIAKNVANDLEHWTREKLSFCNDQILQSATPQLLIEQFVASGVQLAEQCKSALSELKKQDQATGVNVVGNLGMFVSSCVRHGISENDHRLTSVIEVLRDLGQHFQHPPRESLYTYVIFNEPDSQGRFKAFTTSPDEQNFIRLTRAGVQACGRALKEVAQLDINEPQDAVVRLHRAVDALKEYKETFVSFLRPGNGSPPSVNPDVFFDHLRHFFPVLEIGGTKYGPPSAAYMSAIMELDLRLGQSDEFQKQHTRARLAYFLPPERESLEQALNGNSLLVQLLGSDAAKASVASVKDNLHARGLTEVAKALLAVCEQSATAASAHWGLVNNYLVQPKKTRDVPQSTGNSYGDHSEPTISGCPMHKMTAAMGCPVAGVSPKQIVDPSKGASGMSFEQVRHLRYLRKNHPLVELLRSVC